MIEYAALLPRKKVTLAISFIWIVCSWSVINEDASLKGFKSSDVGKDKEGIFYNSIFFSWLLDCKLVMFPNATTGGLFHDMQQDSPTLSFHCLFYLLPTRTPKHHLILTSCTKKLLHRKCFVFVLFDLFCYNYINILVLWPGSVFMFGKATGKVFLDT